MVNAVLTLLMLGCEPVADPTSDRDGDGVPFSEDCDDLDATRYPGAIERCDGYDEDCDGATDDDATDAITWYDDLDGDGFGDDATARLACVQPRVGVTVGGDCDDEDATVNPDARETCDGHDEDCDTEIDEDAIGAIFVFADADGDGFGDPDVLVEGCDPEGVDDATDCDDTDATVFPGADELCDGVDTDCDDLPDVGALDGTTYYVDADGDGYGSGDGTVDCAADGRSTNRFDCDDASADVNPVDGGCALDGEVLGSEAGVVIAGDEGAGLGSALVVEDLDGDGFDDLLAAAPNLLAGRVYTWSGPLTGAETTASPDALRAGTTDGQAFGTSLAVGDLNGDGVADLVVGGPGDTTSGTTAGAAWLFSGPVTGEARITEGLGIYAEGGRDSFGTSLSAPGDVDGDGAPDLLVGAPDYGNTGRVYLLSGPITATPDLAAATATFTGVGSLDTVGERLAGGDLDGDGLAEVIIGAPGNVKVYVFAGGTVGAQAASDATSSIGGRGSTYVPGYDVAYVGDADGDGLGDLLIGGPSYLAGSPSGVGEAWLLTGPLDGDRDLPDDVTATFVGEATGDLTGWRVAGGSDHDGDGVIDLLLATVGSDRSATDGGGVFFLPGNSSGTVLLASATTVIEGDTENGSLGKALAVGDLDGEAYPDVAVGAPDEGDEEDPAGTVRAFLGGNP